MLVTFSSPAGGDVSLFEEHARLFIKFLGFGQVIPGAIYAEDIPQALVNLKAGLADAQRQEREVQAQLLQQQEIIGQGAKVVGQETVIDEIEEAVPLSTRAHPLLLLLNTAAKEKTYIMWQIKT